MSNMPYVNEKSLFEWEKQWKPIGSLKNVYKCKSAPREVGVYRAKQEGKIVYVGVGAEYDNGGLRKRLADYVREDGGGRQNEAGRLLNENSNSLEIDILVTGSDSCAADAARRLEHGFIFLYHPPWNFLPRRRSRR